MATPADTVEREISDMQPEQTMVALLNKSEIDQQIVTAHRFPRSLKRFRDEALQMVTLTENIAKECIYALPRDGKTIEGPSARFAEIVASAWGNCRAGARVVSDQGDFVTAQGVFHDLERNVAITYEVQRHIVNNKGRRYSADMIGVTANAACSIALRNAVLKGVPKAFWNELYSAARRTIAGDVKTLANRRADAIKEFLIFGVTEQKILQTLNKTGIQDIGIDDLVTLHGILTAIKEGDTTPEQTFATAQTATADTANEIKERLKKTQPKAAPASPETTAPTMEDAINAVKADDIDLARDIAGHLPEEQKVHIEKAIENR